MVWVASGVADGGSKSLLATTSRPVPPGKTAPAGVVMRSAAAIPAATIQRVRAIRRCGTVDPGAGHEQPVIRPSCQPADDGYNETRREVSRRPVPVNTAPSGARGRRPERAEKPSTDH